MGWIARRYSDIVCSSGGTGTLGSAWKYKVKQTKSDSRFSSSRALQAARELRVSSILVSNCKSKLAIEPGKQISEHFTFHPLIVVKISMEKRKRAAEKNARDVLTARFFFLLSTTRLRNLMIFLIWSANVCSTRPEGTFIKLFFPGMKSLPSSKIGCNLITARACDNISWAVCEMPLTLDRRMWKFNPGVVSLRTASMNSLSLIKNYKVKLEIIEDLRWKIWQSFEATQNRSLVWLRNKENKDEVLFVLRSVIQLKSLKSSRQKRHSRWQHESRRSRV